MIIETLAIFRNIQSHKFRSLIDYLLKFRLTSSLVFILLLVACGTPSHFDAPLNGILPMQVPGMVNPGEQIEIAVGPVSASNGTPVGLIMVGTHGPKTYNTVFEAGMAYFTIPATDTLQPGYLAFIAAAGDARGEASSILAPRGAVSTLLTTITAQLLQLT